MRRIDFLVHDVRVESGRCYVTGRNCGDALRVGDTFTRWLRDRADGSPNVQASFRVESIEAYRHLLNQIDSGMTAELGLRIDDSLRIEAGTLLGEAELEPFAAGEVTAILAPRSS